MSPLSHALTNNWLIVTPKTVWDKTNKNNEYQKIGSIQTYQQVIYLSQFFPLSLASIWPPALDYPTHDIAM